MYTVIYNTVISERVFQTETSIISTAVRVQQSIKPHRMPSRSDMDSQMPGSQEQEQNARERRGAEGGDMDFSHDPDLRSVLGSSQSPNVKKRKVMIGRDAMCVHRDKVHEDTRRTQHHGVSHPVIR